ncbi:MAG TPA: NUDIX domain-containing protein [Granulicella sp.]
MRERPAARWILLDPQDRVLLFRFDAKEGPLVGFRFWATPGGAVEPGESFAEAACRELREETGLELPADKCVHTHEVELRLFDGDLVRAEERFFLGRVGSCGLSDSLMTDEERRVIAEHRWWSVDELRATTEKIFPEMLVEIMERIASEGSHRG